jgi:hypothetical protein
MSYQFDHRAARELVHGIIDTCTRNPGVRMVVLMDSVAHFVFTVKMIEAMVPKGTYARPDDGYVVHIRSGDRTSTARFEPLSNVLVHGDWQSKL